MGNILLISEDDFIINKYTTLFATHKIKFSSCCTETTIYDYMETESADIVILDEKLNNPDLLQIIKRIKSISENTQLLLITNGDTTQENYTKYINGFIYNTLSDEMILSAIDVYIKNKQHADDLSEKNKALADSLYRLNVLYGTSSKFAGTLEIKQLLESMIEGLDKSLSFDLTSTLSFGFENEPVLIINSLYDISDEIMNALKLRAILNYKSLFENKTPPFEINDKDLKTVKIIKNPTNKFTFTIFQFDNMFAPIDLGDNFFGCIEIFKEKHFTTDDASYFQTIVQQVSLPLKSAGLYKQLIEKNEELKKLEQVKSEFISIVSHELRTPLTPIKNALNILSGGRCGKLNQDGTKFIDMAARNVKVLTNIINDILDISKIEAGKMDFNYKLMNIHSVIENVKTSFDYEAKEQGINLTAAEQKDLPDVYADPQRLGQVLRNLVSNAIKFTPEGKGITIKSELKNASAIEKNPYFAGELDKLKGEYVVISVIDEGIGIKSENLLKAFENFTQIENTLSRKVGGTGLGLPIAKRLVKAHNGAIWCDSEENKGSRFYVAIPATQQHSEIN